MVSSHPLRQDAATPVLEATPLQVPGGVHQTQPCSDDRRGTEWSLLQRRLPYSRVSSRTARLSMATSGQLLRPQTSTFD